MSSFFFFNDTATTEIYTLSLHDALPIFLGGAISAPTVAGVFSTATRRAWAASPAWAPRTLSAAQLELVATRSEEHTSELQSRLHLVCRLLLEKKKKNAHAMMQHRDHDSD